MAFCFGDLGHISRTPWSLLVLQFGHNQRSMTGKTSWSFIMFKSGCARIRAKTLYKKRHFFFKSIFFFFSQRNRTLQKLSSILYSCVTQEKPEVISTHLRLDQVSTFNPTVYCSFILEYRYTIVFMLNLKTIITTIKKKKLLHVY